MEKNLSAIEENLKTEEVKLTTHDIHFPGTPPLKFPIKVEGRYQFIANISYERSHLFSGINIDV